MPIASGAVVVCPLDHVHLQSFGRPSRGCGRLFLWGTSEGYCSSHFLPSPFEYEQRMVGITAVRHHSSSGLKLSVRFFLVFAPSNGADWPSALRTRTPQKSPFLIPEVVFFCVLSVALGTFHKQNLVSMRVPASWFDVVDGWHG